MRFFNCFPLRVHCWGGLGSQLYALSLAYDLRIKFSKRKIKLLLHTGGFTKRVSELDFIHDIGFETIQINDFQAQDKEYRNHQKSIKIILKKIVIKILYFLKFIVSANSNADFEKVYPWTISTRGHYFDREISSDFYEYLLDYIKIEEKPIIRSQFEIAIHYRMGDLLILTEKSISPANKIIDAIREVKKNQNNVKINVYSDSPRIAKETLFTSGLTDDFIVNDISTIDVMRACVGADCFIGTGSKVSLWIVNIRRYMGEVNNYYPEGFESKLYNPGQNRYAPSKS
jgi:hypothetical protein